MENKNFLRSWKFGFQYEIWLSNIRLWLNSSLMEWTTRHNLATFSSESCEQHVISYKSSGGQSSGLSDLTCLPAPPFKVLCVFLPPFLEQTGTTWDWRSGLRKLRKSMRKTQNFWVGPWGLFTSPSYSTPIVGWRKVKIKPESFLLGMELEQRKVENLF